VLIDCARVVVRGPRLVSIRALACQQIAEHRMVGLGHSEQVRDDQQRERLPIGRDELALPVFNKLVDQLIGEVPHELLVLLQPFRREQPVEQRAVCGVPRRIKGDEVFVHRELITMGLDELGDVVNIHLERQRKGALTTS